MLQNTQTCQISTPPLKSLYCPHSRPVITPARSLGSGLLPQVSHIINSLTTPTSAFTKTPPQDEMVLPGAQGTMTPDPNLNPLEKRAVEDITQQLSDIREAQLSVAKNNTTLQHHAAKVEAAAAKLAGITAAEVVRKRSRWDGGSESFAWALEAERARLGVQVEKIRRELENVRACAEQGWGKRDRLDKELEKMIEGAIRAIREVARLRVESERTGAEEGVTKEFAKAKRETMRLLRELPGMTKERAKMHCNDFKPMPETDRLGVESERLRVGVDALVVSMTEGNWQKAARD
ncbi:hypothetical protein DFP73DRAFT_567171 [Morchella snyderi]|nr:hypothetical protein DFP73DRAFT_567171 [Morchella snyderi]